MQTLDTPDARNVSQGSPHWAPSSPASADESGSGTDLHGSAERVTISSLVFKDSPRLAGENAEHIHVLADARTELPPILVHRSTMQVIDGMHRVRAAQLQGKDTISAQFIDGDEDAAFILAVKSNITHGLPLSHADRRAAAARIIADCPAWSDRAIATATGLSDGTVRSVRKGSCANSTQSNDRIGKDGRVRPMNSAERRQRAWEMMTAFPSMALRTVAETAGISLGTAHDVRKRMRRGDDPIPPKLRAKTADRSPTVRKTEEPEQTDPKKIFHRDPQSTLKALAQDPSLKMTDSGRRVLRWLHSHAIESDDWVSMVEAIPGHRADAVADLARCCAASWSAFAAELENRDDAPA